jgi:hypothetical protein
MTPKQTAVEWLQVQLNENGKLSAVDFYQAKAMEKEQHKQTWFDSTAQFDNAAAMTYKKDFEQYYNETYKTKTP